MLTIKSGLCVCVTGAALWWLPARAQTNGEPERFTASAVNLNRGAVGAIEISVERWSSDASTTG